VHSSGLPKEALKRQDMSLGQVRDVDIIANGGTIRSGVIVSVDLDFEQFTQRGLDYMWDQVWFRILLLTQFILWIGTCCVEIAQHDRAQPVTTARALRG